MMPDPTPEQYGQTFGEGLNRSYVTKEGDTPESVAAYFYGSESRRDALKDRNPAIAGYAEMASIRPGMRLRVPDESGVELSDRRGVTEGEGADRTYITKGTDTLEEIATYFYGAATHRTAIEEANAQIAGLDPWATLPPGLTLKVPSS